MDSVADVLFKLRTRGVRVWVDHGQLRYQTMNGALTQEEIDNLQRRKANIIDYLQRIPTPVVTVPLQPRLPTDRVPLTFSQQWLWNLYEIGQHSFRVAYTATKLSGHLNVAALKQSVLGLLRRHESLNSRVLIVNGSATQELDGCNRQELQVADLMAMRSSDREGEARRLIKQLICEPIDLSVGPLFEVKLIKLGENQYVLATVMDHLISDGASLRILWRDIWAMYARSEKGTPISLPKLPIQFADYAVWQRKTARVWASKHEAYWAERLAGAKGLSLFEGQDGLIATSSNFAKQVVRVGNEIHSQLSELSRRARTTLAMSVLSVYVALVFRWCNEADLVVPFIGMGRPGPEVENVIGCFISPLYLRVELTEDDSFLDLLRRVTEEYGRAYQHCDYGFIGAQIPRPEFAWNSHFNWLPRELHPSAYMEYADVTGSGVIQLEQFSVGLGSDDLKWEVPKFQADLQFQETNEGLVGSIYYSSARIAKKEIEQFQRNFLVFAERFVRDPSSRVSSMLCVE